MNENYRFVPETGIAYVVRDPGGAFTGNYFSALYGAADGKVVSALSFDMTRHENSNQSYIVDSSYEEAYYYTTQSGCEFLITADSGHVWLNAAPHTRMSALSGRIDN
ncbi:MAG: hypothetical protein ACLTGM_04735 [Oscillospiraceae bacterium]